jgi:hypothetical protein
VGAHNIDLLKLKFQKSTEQHQQDMAKFTKCQLLARWLHTDTWRGFEEMNRALKVQAKRVLRDEALLVRNH